MDRISAFDMIKVGIGPSSSHTMGPWGAALRSLDDLRSAGLLDRVDRARVTLYGSLAKTGLGHGTHMAVTLGLTGDDYLTTDTATAVARSRAFRDAGRLPLAGTHEVDFDIDSVFQPLPFHPNGVTFAFALDDGAVFEATYYSVGGGFVVKEGEEAEAAQVTLPYPSDLPAEFLRHCAQTGLPLSEVIRCNERAWRTDDAVNAKLDALHATMRAAVYKGCHTEGTLPGGLDVKRRAPARARRLLGLDGSHVLPQDVWFSAIAAQKPPFQQMLRWVTCFALATNEENAAFGRIVTAPTNGACGVLPAVLFYFMLFEGHNTPDAARRFLLVAGETGSFFKKNATISAAMGGCQAEIGVSSAMAAAALAEGLGGSPEQAFMAAEIAMEHHLGLTCDPIGGLVQVPCIERNAMGAIKAITAAHLAVESDPKAARVSLDAVIQTMWETAQDMSAKYKETSDGGLAQRISVNVAEC